MKKRNTRIFLCLHGRNRDLGSIQTQSMQKQVDVGDPLRRLLGCQSGGLGRNHILQDLLTDFGHQDVLLIHGRAHGHRRQESPHMDILGHGGLGHEQGRELSLELTEKTVVKLIPKEWTKDEKIKK